MSKIARLQVKMRRRKREQEKKRINKINLKRNKALKEAKSSLVEARALQRLKIAEVTKASIEAPKRKAEQEKRERIQRRMKKGHAVALKGAKVTLKGIDKGIRGIGGLAKRHIKLGDWEDKPTPRKRRKAKK